MSDMGKPQAARKVPGSYGLPVLGRVIDTLEFFVFGGWRRFFERRRDRHGSTVFKVNLFQPTIALLDHEAIEPLFAAGDLIQDYGFSWARPPLPLVGHVPPSVFGKGPDHDQWKALYIALLQRRAATLEQTLHEVLGRYLKCWMQDRDFGWQAEIENLTAEFLFAWIAGSRPDPRDVRLVYGNIFLHLAPWLTRLWPSSTYSRSLVAYGRLLAEIKSGSGFAEITKLATEHGLQNDDVTAKQLAFLIGMNGFLGTQCLIKIIVGELSRQPGLADRLRAELHCAVGAGAPRLAQIVALPRLDHALREMLRLHPPVSFIFGRAMRRRTIRSQSGTFQVERGELLMGVIPFAHEDPAQFANPLRFDHKRHDDPDTARLLIWPRGPHDVAAEPGDRICPGKDAAMLIAKLVCAALLQFDWRLAQPVEWDNSRFSLNVAAPKGPLMVRDFHRLER